MSPEAEDPPRTSRGCYCGLWQTQPDFYPSRGIPPGFCGHCTVCGEPGHTRHHPGAPVTSCWCDRHYRRVSLLHPQAPCGCVVWLLGLVGVVNALRWLLS